MPLGRYSDDDTLPPSPRRPARPSNPLQPPPLPPLTTASPLDCRRQPVRRPPPPLLRPFCVSPFQSLRTGSDRVVAPVLLSGEN